MRKTKPNLKLMNEYLCGKTGIAVCVKKTDDTEVTRSKHLKIRLKKSKIDLKVYFELYGLGHLIHDCGFCGDYNHDIQMIKHDVVDGRIIPTGFTKRFETKFCCHNKMNNCPSKKMNPNSVKFISVAYGKSSEEARIFLHERNSSPFYRSNHSSDDDYKKSQSRSEEWFKENNKDRDEWISSANKSRSLTGYKEKYGEIEGTEKWNAIQQEKAITIDNMIERYGEQEGITRYNEWLSKVKATLKNSISKHGSIKGLEIYLKKTHDFINSRSGKSFEMTYDGFIDYIISYVKDHKLFEFKCFDLDCAINHKFYTLSKEFYGVDSAKIDSDIQIKIPEYKSSDMKIFSNNYSYYSYSDLGTILKSYHEITAFRTLKKNGLVEKIDYHINGKYPSSTRLYDFYFPTLDKYIEIAGRIDNNDYVNLMIQKHYEFGSVIIHPTNIKQTFTEISRLIK